MSTNLSNRVFRNVRVAVRPRWLITLGAVLCAAVPPAQAGCRIAVIDGGPSSPVNSGQGWCDFLNENGHECTLFPITGPTDDLESYSIVLDCSQQWSDPMGVLPNHLRKGKTLILWGDAPVALGIASDPQVQALVGASGEGIDSSKLLTVATDPIFGAMPPGSEVGDCAASLCTGLLGTEAFASSKPLARFSFGTGLVGIHRNTWNGGRSFYLSDGFTAPSTIQRQLMLRIIETSCAPIPVMSIWGAVVMGVILAIASSLILRRRALAGF